MPYAYRKSERIRKNEEFSATMKGKRLSDDGLSLFYAGNKTGNFRIGITVGKRLANAARRNKLKRRIRSCIMKVLQEQTSGIDVVIAARKELLHADYGRIMRSVERVFFKAGIQTRKQDKTAS